MPSVVAIDPRPYRGELAFGLTRDEARTALQALAEASARPGRVHRVPLAPPAPTFPRGRAYEALEIVADAGASEPVALSGLAEPTLRVVVKPGVRTSLHEALREVEEGGWDFSRRIAVADPVEMPKMAKITVTFL